MTFIITNRPIITNLFKSAQCLLLLIASLNSPAVHDEVGFSLYCK